MQETGAEALDVHRAVEDRYNAGSQAVMVGTVWTDGGCRS